MANVVHLHLRFFDSLPTGQGLEKNDISGCFEYEAMVYQKSEKWDHSLGAPECKPDPDAWGMKKVSEGLIQS
jgi:hypothetical protein